MPEFEQLLNDSQQGQASVPYWGNNKQSSYKEIVLKQIETCRVEGSKQMVGESSFYQKDNNGNFYQIHLFDQKKIYIQCVKSLYDLMLRYFDEDMKKKDKELNEKLKGLSTTYINLYVKREPLQHFKTIAQQTGVIQKNAVGSRVLSELEEARWEIYRELYQELLLLFDRKNELSGKRTVSLY